MASKDDKKASASGSGVTLVATHVIRGIGAADVMPGQSFVTDAKEAERLLQLGAARHPAASEPTPEQSGNEGGSR